MVAWVEAPGCFLCCRSLSLVGGDGREMKLVSMIQSDRAEFYVEARVDVPIRPGGGSPTPSMAAKFNVLRSGGQEKDGWRTRGEGYTGGEQSNPFLFNTNPRPNPPLSVDALKAIRGSLIDPFGRLNSWNRGDPCTGNWSHVICYNATSKIDGYLHIQELQLLALNLSGTLAPELGQLSQMRIMDFMWNSIGGSIPKDVGNITSLELIHMNNNSLSGQIPPELSRLPSLVHLLLDNNNLSGYIPPELLKLPKVLIMSLRNCSLEGLVPDVSGIPQLGYLSLDNNNLDGSVPSNIWQNIDLSGNRSLILDFQNNALTNLSTPLSPPDNVTILLHGNPVCTVQNQQNISQYCQSTPVVAPGGSSSNSTLCGSCSTDLPYERVPMSPMPCSCAIPLYVDYRLKSPGFSNFIPYEVLFQQYLSSGLSLLSYQLEVSTFMWEEGPRLKMYLKLFPNNTILFNASEVSRLRGMFTGWQILDSDIFGPYELINFNPGWYNNTKRISMKISGVKDFTFEELSHCTNDFDDSTPIGLGGYGKVYRGLLADGTVVAIKRAQQGSLQGSKEFFTEIELLSRLHHRNLVSLLGYCDEEDEQPHSVKPILQMLVYEFMPNGNLRDHLSAKAKVPLDFPMRLRIALGSSRGILYLHTEADPPIYHRDIKASNILLDSRFVAKVADFGLSRLAPLPETEGSAPGHVSTVVKGTPGYLDPEYFLTHKLTDKSDVYSLGVVFLELLTGMQPISHGRNIVREVLAANQSGMIFSVVDNRMGSYPAECVETFAVLALRCCQDETDARPSMVEVVRELEMIWKMTPGTENIASSESGALAMGSSSSNTTGTPTASSASRMASSDDHYISSMEVSGSNLLSGVVPSINPC
ncbi:hypothetical protein C2845_PM15G00320 [Panicum miliaceum]|uniref:non-specific serine/threonine protein kinase n=1 Tax=Panicum miliaceum TaxID=4540 RepID=A0A3L6Q983_PANMI|nr:hypothetical protein C2845_PM15G00320 [Panicum miliaceum]